MAKNEAMVPSPEIDELSATRPAYVKDTRRGVEEQTANDIIFPRIVLCQSQTPQVKRSNPAYVEGLAEGDMFNSLLGTIYGSHLTVIPIYFFKMRMMFRPLDEGGGVVCMSRDASHCTLEGGGPCTHDRWGSNGEKPECMEIANWFCYLPKTREQIIWSCKATSLEAARQLNSLTRLTQGDAWSKAYEVRSIGARGPGGQDYFTFAVKPLGWVSEDTYRACEQMYQGIVPAIKAGRAGVDVSGLEEDEATSFNPADM